MKEETNVQDFIDAQNEAHAMLLRVLDPVLGAEGITVPQAMTLKSLKDHEQMCRMSDLAASRFLTPAAATGIVDRLIHLGLVQRHFDQKDRRVILLDLTEQGKATTARVEHALQQLMLGFFQRITESERAASLRMFRKLKEYLGEELAAPRKK
jgi:MarR family transcriptional regulator, organic hydroperoxide resistance regulator